MFCIFVFSRWRHAEICMRYLVLLVRNDVSIPVEAVEIFIKMLNHDQIIMRLVRCLNLKICHLLDPQNEGPM